MMIRLVIAFVSALILFSYWIEDAIEKKGNHTLLLVLVFIPWFLVCCYYCIYHDIFCTNSSFISPPFYSTFYTRSQPTQQNLQSNVLFVSLFVGFICVLLARNANVQIRERVWTASYLFLPPTKCHIHKLQVKIFQWSLSRSFSGTFTVPLCSCSTILSFSTVFSTDNIVVDMFHSDFAQFPQAPTFIS